MGAQQPEHLCCQKENTKKCLLLPWTSLLFSTRNSLCDPHTLPHLLAWWLHHICLGSLCTSLFFSEFPCHSLLSTAKKEGLVFVTWCLEMMAFMLVRQLRGKAGVRNAEENDNP